MHTFSQEAMERPFRTLQAAGVLRENAETIGRAAAGAGEDEIIVAVVNCKRYTDRGSGSFSVMRKIKLHAEPASGGGRSEPCHTFGV